MSLTPKQEKFCLVYHATGNASEAYKAAYNAEKMIANSIYCEASKLLDDPKIAQRIAEIKEEDRKKNAVTVESIAAELDEARAMAIALGQTSAAVAAAMGKAKLFGLLVDKVEKKEMVPEKIPEEVLNEQISQYLDKSIIAAHVSGESASPNAPRGKGPKNTH